MDGREYWAGPVMTTTDDGAPYTYAGEYGERFDGLEAASARAWEMSCLSSGRQIMVAVLKAPSKPNTRPEVVLVTDGEPILGPVSVWGEPWGHD